MRNRNRGFQPSECFWRNKLSFITPITYLNARHFIMSRWTHDVQAMNNMDPALQPSSSGGTGIINREETNNVEDPFDNTDFNAAQYVNDLFPDGMYQK